MLLDPTLRALVLLVLGVSLFALVASSVYLGAKLYLDVRAQHTREQVGPVLERIASQLGAVVAGQRQHDAHISAARADHERDSARLTYVIGDHGGRTERHVSVEADRVITALGGDPGPRPPGRGPPTQRYGSSGTRRASRPDSPGLYRMTEAELLEEPAEIDRAAGE